MCVYVIEMPSSSHIIASISSVFDNLNQGWKGSNDTEVKKWAGLLLYQVGVLRTFVLCSAKLRTELTLVNKVRTFVLCSTSLDNSHSDVDASLGSLLVRVEAAAENCLAAYNDRDFLQFLEDMNHDINEWYVNHLLNPDFLRQSRTLRANRVEEIADSILANLDGFLNLDGSAYDTIIHKTLVALKESITFWRQLIHLATLIAFAETHVFRDLLAQIEALVISAAHLTLNLFSVRVSHFYADDVSRSRISYAEMKSKVSALLLRMDPFNNLHLHDTHIRALASMKSSRKLHVPAVDLKDFIAFLMSTQWEMLQFDSCPEVSWKDKLQVLYEGLRSLRTMLRKKVNKFDDKIMGITADTVYDAGVAMFSLYKQDFTVDNGISDFLENMKVIQTRVLEEIVVKTSRYNFLSTSLQFIRESMMTIKTDSTKILNDKGQEIKVKEEVAMIWTSTDHQMQSSMPAADDQVVGFEIERSSIINRLIRGSKRLQVVSIVGMPGLGKTTLAAIVYNDPSASLHFHVRGWCSISQVFNKKKVLLELLNQVQEKFPNNDITRNEDDLAEELWRSLKGRRYLIVMDDVWDLQAFDYLKGILPDDSTESRILLTSRDTGLLDEEPHFLRLLTCDESLELLGTKLFPEKDWPHFMYDFGTEIAEYCKGLPLTIVIVAGLLRATKKEDWKEVLKSLRSGVISTTDQCMNTIELSYKHLPDHLKSCLLLFGAFPEDHELSVKRLIWYWIAEGFVKKSEGKSLEEVARDYLENLIDRSLVMKAKERSRGGIKTCRIHDLLYDFCLRKSNEESFLHQFKVKSDEAEEHLSSDELEFDISSFDKPEILSFIEIGNLRRLCIYSKPESFKKCKLLCPRLRSLIFFHPTKWPKPDEFYMSYIARMYKLLRVLDIEQVCLTEFSKDVGLLLQLRYLAIQVVGDVGPSIGNLLNLETLILVSTVTLPDTFWNLGNLRHLYLNNKWRSKLIVLPEDSLDRSLLDLVSLSSLSCYNWGMMDTQLRKFPNIRQINCKFYVSEDDLLNGSKVMDFSFLSQLESLTLSVIPDLDRSDFEFIFPENIKKLSLSECGLSWSRISKIAELPNLVVLKLLGQSFVGDEWHVEEGEFPKLKFLKLENLDLVKWTASDDQFPNLEKLILEDCSQLEEIPECLENVAALKRIEVLRCTESVVSSVEKVEDYQRDMGNSVLQVYVRSIWDDASKDTGASLWQLD